MYLLLWPFRLIWGFICLLFGLMGRLLSVIIGAVLLMAGAVLTFTIVGAFVGIPLLLVGGLLVIRAFF